jgi:hypothetical protein
MNNTNKHITFYGKNIFPLELKNKILQRILSDNSKCESKYRHGSEHGDYEKHSDYGDHKDHYDVHTDHNDHGDHNN